MTTTEFRQGRTTESRQSRTTESRQSRTTESRLRRGARATALVVATTLSAGVTGALAANGVQRVAGNKMAPWILGRAAGLCAYLSLVCLVLLGLLLSHPLRSRVPFPSTATRIRIHIALSAFTLVFVVLHVVVLATDPYAGVGWSGALLPMHASYRPVATTLGLIGAWSGLVAGLTAALAGHLPRRLWWPLHKVAGVSLVLVWLHGVVGGGDTPALLVLYIATAALVVLVALSRYVARTPADLADEARR